MIEGNSRRRFLVVFSTFGLMLLGWALPAAGFTAKQEREIYAALDPDGTGKVTREQFDARKMDAFYLHRYPDAAGRMKPLTFEETGLSREFFDRADTDHDGLLDGIEMMDAVRFEDIDVKGRGYFDFSDLVVYLKKIGR
jgi:hypothetical protein